MLKQDRAKIYYVCIVLKLYLTLSISSQSVNVGQLFLLETIFYFALFLWHDFLGMLIASIFASLSFIILVISWIVERIERSKVPSWYYHVMITSIASPLLVIVFFAWLNRG